MEQQEEELLEMAKQASLRELHMSRDQESMLLTEPCYTSTPAVPRTKRIQHNKPGTVFHRITLFQLMIDFKIQI